MSTATATKACGACAHWKAQSASQGECRRHAPQTILFKVDGEVKYESKFPVTKSEDWCGDFAAK